VQRPLKFVDELGMTGDSDSDSSARTNL